MNYREDPSSRRPCRDAIPRSVPICRPSLIRSFVGDPPATAAPGASLVLGFDDRLTGFVPFGWIVGLIPGPREWLLVALVVAALYGRSEIARRGFARVFRPWKTPAPASKGQSSARPSWLSDRWFVLLTAVACSAVATWVVTWMILVHRRP